MLAIYYFPLYIPNNNIIIFVFIFVFVFISSNWRIANSNIFIASFACLLKVGNISIKGDRKLIAFSYYKAFKFVDSRVRGKEGFDNSIDVSLISKVIMLIQVLPEVF